MNYQKIIGAVFLSRPNRFVATVDIEGKCETVHVKNTGRCRELLLPGTSVILAESQSPNRKTKYDLVAVYKDSKRLINIDSQAPNRAMYEWLCTKPKPFSDVTMIRPEYSYGNSRVDFYLECGKEEEKRKILLEVKGCTLEIDGIGYFPDAPTERGVKHLRELRDATSAGYECYVAFVIPVPEVEKVLPNRATHKEFAEALSEALKAGVHMLWLPCEVNEKGFSIIKAIEGFDTI